ncbi:hypothetical protein DL765_010657 [Monosporascus sp. GIB2]|nr:hypothetical protein DL765_010657 [Monosporascus sp. GIB2]
MVSTYNRDALTFASPLQAIRHVFIHPYALDSEVREGLSALGEQVLIRTYFSPFLSAYLLAAPLDLASPAICLSSVLEKSWRTISASHPGGVWRTQTVVGCVGARLADAEAGWSRTVTPTRAPLVSKT